VTGDWREKCLMRSFITYTLRQTEWSSQGGWDVQACRTKGGEEDCIEVIGGNARRTETTRKAKT
jgi:hypothetical protein